MIKPKALKEGDTIAIVSLSSGMGGDNMFRYRYEIGKERLEKIFKLNVKTMPNALKGSNYLDEHPEKRAQDLMEAFKDPSIKAIICMVGGDDTIRLLPYIDYEIIKNNPKIFMGYSDTTINHFMMYKAGLVSFYGPCVLVEFAENKEMHKYTIDSIFNTLFCENNALEIKHSPLWTSEYLDWCDKNNMNISRKLIEDKHSYEILQGNTIVQGKLIGGCLDVFCMMIGTEIWPSPKEFENAILFLETSEDCPSPTDVCYFLRNLAAQGIIDKINGIVVGKPLNEKYYEEYKEIYTKVIGKEAKRPDLPILYNVNFGHNAPQSIIPYGVMAQIDCTKKSFSIIENSLV